jgi:hypothetical protein
MDTPSVAMYTVTAESGGYYPIGLNKVTINKYADGNFNIITECNGVRYTKESFVNAYDSIGHHKVELNSADIGDLIVDMDSIWECISGCGRYVKPNRILSIVFSNIYKV